jgi:hypothetical protein
MAAVLIAPAIHAQTKQLFNGKNLDGWAFAPPTPGEEGFAVNNGLIETTGPGKAMLWYTREKIGNAVLKVVFKMSNDKGNSGVFIRIPLSRSRRAMRFTRASRCRSIIATTIGTAPGCCIR